jgi:hypothetical protein
VSTADTADGFVVSDDRHTFVYDLDQRETETRGVLTMTGAQAGVREGGAVITLHYLSDDAAEHFRRNHGKGACPAPFFNRHAHQRILIPATPAVEAALRKVNFEDYRVSADWRGFSVRGRCVRGLNDGKRDGLAIQMPRNMFNDCMTMVATGIDIDPAAEL